MTYWEKCQALLREELTESAYRTWFAGIVPVSFEGNKLVLRLQSQFIAEYIEDNYIDQFSHILFRVFGPSTRLEYQIMIDRPKGMMTSSYSQGVEQEKLGMDRPASSLSYLSQQQQRDRIQPQLPPLDSRLNPSQTFDSFVQGECNKMARTVALTVARDPGNTAFNPLFIYGGSGVGKTHLANAIGNQVKRMYPDKRVLYLSANDFKLQFMEASNPQNNNLANFLGFYQTIDVLIVDDIQILSRLEKTQEAFFHIFNHLHQSKKQIILTSDKSPLEIKDVQDRLITRFKWGFSGELQRPDFSLRRDILRNKIYRDGVELDDEIVNFIAENVRDNVRDLEGVLASLLAYSTLSDEQISMELAERVVSQIVDIMPSCLTMQDIMQVVAEEYGVTVDMLISTARTKTIALVRQIAMYLCKKLTNKPLQEIGSAFGGRTHATVLHAITTVDNLMAFDTVLQRQINKLESKLVK